MSNTDQKWMDVFERLMKFTGQNLARIMTPPAPTPSLVREHRPQFSSAPSGRASASSQSPASWQFHLASRDPCQEISEGTSKGRWARKKIEYLKFEGFFQFQIEDLSPITLFPFPSGLTENFAVQEERVKFYKVTLGIAAIIIIIRPKI